MGVYVRDILYYTYHNFFLQKALMFSPILNTISLCILPFPPGPSPPTDVNVNQNAAGSVQVSWKPPSSGPDVTKYMIYCKQRDKEQTISKSAAATANTATINGLVTGEYCSITMVAFSNDISSTETTAQEVTINEGM